MVVLMEKKVIQNFSCPVSWLTVYTAHGNKLCHVNFRRYRIRYKALKACCLRLYNTSGKSFVPGRKTEIVHGLIVLTGIALIPRKNTSVIDMKLSSQLFHIVHKRAFAKHKKTHPHAVQHTVLIKVVVIKESAYLGKNI